MRDNKNDSVVGNVADTIEQLAGLLVDKSLIQAAKATAQKAEYDFFTDSTNAFTIFSSVLGDASYDVYRRQLQVNMQQILNKPESFTDDQIRFHVGLAIIAVRDYEYLGQLSAQLDAQPQHQGDALSERISAERDRINKEFVEGGDIESWQRGLANLALGIQSNIVIETCINSNRVVQDQSPKIKVTPEEAESRAKTIIEFLETFSDRLKLEQARDAVAPVIDIVRSRFNIFTLPGEIGLGGDANRPNPPKR